MTLTRFHPLALAAVLALATSGAQAVTLLSEGFDNVSMLADQGWVLRNSSIPQGSTDWFQGDQSIFTAQAGSGESYIAANYNNGFLNEAGTRGGAIRNWLITPTFSTSQAGSVSFYVKADMAAGFSDEFTYGFSSGGTRARDFRADLVPTITATGDWTQYTVSFDAQGAGSVGRFALLYTGNSKTNNYIGFDSLTVSAVPEPSTYALFGLGLAGLAFAARRQQRRNG